MEWQQQRYSNNKNNSQRCFYWIKSWKPPADLCFRNKFLKWFPGTLHEGIASQKLLIHAFSALINLICHRLKAFLLIFFPFPGNLLVILVVTLSRRLRSITNFFLANLAVADFCVGIFCVFQNLSMYLIDRWVNACDLETFRKQIIPNDWHHICNFFLQKLRQSIQEWFKTFFSLIRCSWVFGSFMCKAYHFIHSLSYTASIFILVVICMERYLAIQHPITCKQYLTSGRLRVSIHRAETSRQVMVESITPQTFTNWLLVIQTSVILFIFADVCSVICNN